MRSVSALLMPDKSPPPVGRRTPGPRGALSRRRPGRASAARTAICSGQPPRRSVRPRPGNGACRAARSGPRSCGRGPVRRCGIARGRMPGAGASAGHAPRPRGRRCASVGSAMPRPCGRRCASVGSATPRPCGRRCASVGSAMPRPCGRRCASVGSAMPRPCGRRCASVGSAMPRPRGRRCASVGSARPRALRARSGRGAPGRARRRSRGSAPPRRWRRSAPRGRECRSRGGARPRPSARARGRPLPSRRWNHGITDDRSLRNPDVEGPGAVRRPVGGGAVPG